MKDTYLEGAQKEIFTEAKAKFKFPAMTPAFNAKAAQVAKAHFENVYGYLTDKGSFEPKNPKKRQALIKLVENEVLSFLGSLGEDWAESDYEEFLNQISDKVVNKKLTEDEPFNEKKAMGTLKKHLLS